MRNMPDTSNGERGSVLVISLFVISVLTLLGIALATVSSTDTAVAKNEVAFEGSFYAAEAGLHTALAQLSDDVSASIAAIADTDLNDDYSFRSGGKDDTSAQPLDFVGQIHRPGFSAGVGTTYNPSGFVFYQYLVNATGSGPKNAEREIETLADFGPVAQ